MKDLVLVFVSYAALLQIIVVLLFLVVKIKESNSFKFLIAFFTVQFAGVFITMLNHSGYIGIIRFEGNYLILTVVFLYAPLMFFYVRSEINSKHQKFRTIDFIHLLPAFIIDLLLVFYLSAEKYTIINYIFQNQNLLALIFLLQVQSYNGYSLFLIFKHARVNDLFYFIFTWHTPFIIVSYALTSFISMLANLMPYHISINISFISFMLFYSMVALKFMLSPRFKKMPLMAEIDANNMLNRIFKEIEYDIIQNSWFTEPGLLIEEFSEKSKYNVRQVSSAINYCTQMSFSDYLNSLRVEHAKRLIAASVKKDKKLIDLAYESGFKSKTSFNVAFKKHTSITPSEYKKKVRVHDPEP